MLISNSGESEELKNIIQYALRNKNIKKARERLISKLTNRPRMHDIILKL